MFNPVAGLSSYVETPPRKLQVEQGTTPASIDNPYGGVSFVCASSSAATFVVAEISQHCGTAEIPRSSRGGFGLVATH